jgi:hypothetical protein
MLLRVQLRPTRLYHARMSLAPDPEMTAALRVLYVCAYTTRNWTLDEQTPRQQINDLWEAIHEIPHLLARWSDDSSVTMHAYFDEYNAKWDSPNLMIIYQEALEGGDI